MQENKEIKALFKLIDDPDEVVYESVSNKIISLGKDIIPNLEHYSETAVDNDLQEKIEALIQRLQFEDIKEDFKKWNEGKPDLLSGALLVAKYAHPTMDNTFIFKEIEKLRRNIWLEMNAYLTPMEQINVIGSIVYNYYKQKGIEINYNNPDGFLLDKTLELHQGNAYGNGILLLILGNLLDVPFYAINIPKQFILGYFDVQHNVVNPTGHASEKIKFYIDPVNGQMYSHKDVENYFKKMSLPPTSSFFRPFDNKSIIVMLLSELKKCFDSTLTQRSKIKEIEALIAILTV
jgi:regulator of sirC expression with transglutaminase-like and TPR domain